MRSDHAKTEIKPKATTKADDSEVPYRNAFLIFMHIITRKAAALQQPYLNPIVSVLNRVLSAVK